jgi:hypothetical protein
MSFALCHYPGCEVPTRVALLEGATRFLRTGWHPDLEFNAVVE